MLNVRLHGWKVEPCLAYLPPAGKESPDNELPESLDNELPESPDNELSESPSSNPSPLSPTSTLVTQNNEVESCEEIASTPSTTSPQPMHQGNANLPLQSALIQDMQKQGDKRQQQ